MKTVFSDLDGTIIFSHRHEIGERVLVEKLNGKPQAYMTVKGYDALQRFGNKWFIPVTSRTIAQYRRIHFFKDNREPDYALLDNGGVLLKDGKVDIEWLYKTKELFQDDLERLYSFQESLDYAKSKLQDDLILFLRDGDTERAIKAAESEGFMTFVTSGKKYACPPGLTKGAAVNRFKAEHFTGYTVCAGNMKPDISMLSECDEGFFAENLKSAVKADNRVHFLNNTEIAERIFCGI